MVIWGSQVVDAIGVHILVLIIGPMFIINIVIFYYVMIGRYLVRDIIGSVGEDIFMISG